MLAGLQAPPGALVIMDAGIATQAHLEWLVEHGYRSLVVRRGGARQFDEAKAVSIETAAGIHESWASLRQTLCVQSRVTASLRRSDGGMIHVRKSTVAEPALMEIYNALGINALPGGTRKLIC